MDDYYSQENKAKRQLQYDKLKQIEDQIALLQKQYSQLTEEYCKDNYYIKHKYVVYTFIDADILPYNWYNEGPTHIGTMAELFEENNGWISSTTRCE
jgi:hypothetical protein